MDKLLVTLGGVFSIGFIWWFFFGKKFETVETLINEGIIDVTVDGGYKPSVINVKKDTKMVLRIMRRDSNTCLEEIILPDFKIKKYLPLNKEIKIEITPKKLGEFPFHCGMNMFHGKIVVE